MPSQTFSFDRLLVSKSHSTTELPGLLPKGSYLTVENKEVGAKFILRVDDSYQNEPYSPSPLIVDMDLEGLYGDTKCQNVIYAYRVRDISSRSDGKIDYIPPQALARRSSQDEVDLAFESTGKGPIIFLATVHSGQNQLLIDENKHFITSRLPVEMFFHQMLICGKTGSGKTVAMKYLVQYFAEELEGAVLAINVKDIDFLRMDKPSSTKNSQALAEWQALGLEPHGLSNTTVYYPANIDIHQTKDINYNITKKITLDVNTIEPEALTGLLQSISEIGAQSFPDIFRHWQRTIKKKDDKFLDFVNYFNEGAENPIFETQNSRGDISSIPLFKATFNNISRNLINAIEFFDNPDAISLDFKDILYPGKLSVINVAGDKGIEFGSILLRHLLRRIVSAKNLRLNNTPVLVIIDEVHQFYNTESSREALGELDTICRTGRSQKIGVVFASQNQNDIPKGLSSVINTKMFFKTDGITGNLFGVSSDEIQTLRPGFAVANVHNMTQLRILKFPLSLSGVIEE